MRVTRGRVAAGVGVAVLIAAAVTGVVAGSETDRSSAAYRYRHLPTCGSAPTPTGDGARGGYSLSLAVPRGPKGGSMIVATAVVRDRAAPSILYLDGWPIAVVVLHGRIVGQFQGAYGGTGLRRAVGPDGLPLRTSIRLSDCGHRGSRGSPERETSRRSLPPGSYELVATETVVHPSTRTGDILVASAPLTIT